MAVAMTDRSLRFLKASRLWLQDFGVSEAELLGRTSYELAPDTERRYRTLHRRCLRGEQIASEPEPVILPNGARRWMAWEASAWRESNGTIGGLLIISRDLTVQKEAEEEARRSRVFTNTILQNIPVPLVVKDENGRVLMMNRPMEKLYGVTATDHVGKTASELLDPEFAAAITQEDEQALSLEDPLVIEEPQRICDQLGPRWSRKTKVAIRESDGPAYLLTISEDITERRRAQEELERTRNFLTAILDSLPEPLHVKNGADGRIVLVNKAAEALIGLTRESLVGKTAVDLYGPEKAAQLVREDQEVLESGALNVREEDGIVTPGNGTRSVRMMKLGLNDPQGRPHILTVIQDITEQRLAAEELQRTREFLQTVFDNMPAGLTVKDARDGRLLMMNPAVEQIYGIDRGETLGKTGGQIFPPEQADRFASQDREVVESGEMRTFDDERVLTPQGERFVRQRKVLIRNDAGADYLLSISEDITARKQAQDALREAVARAEAANVAKSEFLANMSHEIRTPLNGVLGLADALSRMQLTPEQSEIVGLIVSSGKALTGILSDVLDLAKAEAGQLQLLPEPFSVRDTVGAAAFLFEPVARDKGVAFKVSFDADGPDCLDGDSLRVRQIVSNLISNAVKFTSQGEVAVHAGVVARPDGRADLTVTVKDTGPGFSEEVRAKLFSRFEQGDGSVTRRYGGTGLGLSIASALAQMMDGEISCTAKPGHGAAFIFSAPLAIARGAAGPIRSDLDQSAGSIAKRALRILLAEDHEVNQKVVQLMLDGIAELVITADGSRAIEAFFDAGPFDVVLMDTQMPVMDGLTAIRSIRERETELGDARAPIVSLTANAMAHQVSASLEAGADVHLAKPITAEGLYAAIAKALELAEGGKAHQRPRSSSRRATTR